MSYTPSQATIDSVHKWFGKDGFEYFYTHLLLGGLDMFFDREVEMMGSVHFNAGMHLRNFLRTTPNEEGGLDDENHFDILENEWMKIALYSLKLSKEQCEAVLEKYRTGNMSLEQALTSNEYGYRETAKLFHDYCVEKQYIEPVESA